MEVFSGTTMGKYRKIHCQWRFLVGQPPYVYIYTYIFICQRVTRTIVVAMYLDVLDPGTVSAAELRITLVYNGVTNHSYHPEIKHAD